MIDNGEVHKWASKRTGLAGLEREYDFYEIATISRAAPARIHGFQDRGALTPGYNADIAVYDINPNDFDPSKDPEGVEKAFSNAYYTIKDGQIVVKDGDIGRRRKTNYRQYNAILYPILFCQMGKLSSTRPLCTKPN